MKLLILCQNQFGTHIDTYFYCKGLKNKFEITYLCWDYNEEKQILDGVNIKYVSRNGNIFIRNTRYLRASMAEINSNKFDICFIKYFRGCSILQFFFQDTKFVFDIRTGSINKSNILRNLYDITMRIESIIFPHITIISKSLAKKLWLEKKSTILPLGSVIISSSDKKFDSINLLYVGTFNNRKLYKTIEGFFKFYNIHKNSIKISYTIIGDGADDEIERLKSKVKELDIDNVVNLVGRVPFDKLNTYFENHNVGVSFVPITKYFDIQPVTKTFDYLLSGLPVIATATSENSLIINDINGVLINDSPEGFFCGIEEVFAMRNHYSSVKIRRSAVHCQWDDITNRLGDYFYSLIDGNL